MANQYPVNVPNCEWIPVYTVYYMNFRNICSYSEPWGYDLVGLTVTDELVKEAEGHFINDDIRELLTANQVVRMESNGGLKNLLGRKILSFRREVSVEDDDLGIDFSVCVEKTQEQIEKEKSIILDREFQQYLALKEKFEGTSK
jgi:hypothetical protein